MANRKRYQVLSLILLMGFLVYAGTFILDRTTRHVATGLFLSAAQKIDPQHHSDKAKKIINKEKKVFLGYCIVFFILSVFFSRRFVKYGLFFYSLHVITMMNYYILKYPGALLNK